MTGIFVIEGAKDSNPPKVEIPDLSAEKVNADFKGMSVKIPKIQPFKPDLEQLHSLNKKYEVTFLVFNLLLIFLVPTYHNFFFALIMASFFPAIMTLYTTKNFGSEIPYLPFAIAVCNCFWRGLTFIFVPMFLVGITHSVSACNPMVNFCVPYGNHFAVQIAVGAVFQLIYGLFLYGEAKRVYILTTLMLHRFDESMVKDLVVVIPQKQKEKNPDDIIIAA